MSNDEDSKEEDDGDDSLLNDGKNQVSRINHKVDSDLDKHKIGDSTGMSSRHRGKKLQNAAQLPSKGYKVISDENKYHTTRTTAQKQSKKSEQKGTTKRMGTKQKTAGTNRMNKNDDEILIYDCNDFGILHKDFEPEPDESSNIKQPSTASDIINVSPAAKLLQVSFPKAETETKTSTKNRKQKTSTLEDLDAYNIFLPESGIINNGECMVLVQINPEDATGLDFAGAVGAIGRIEADDQKIILDLKGMQYTGRLFPGPTALLLSRTMGMSAGNPSKNHNAAEDTAIAIDKPYLKVEGITDEFCTLTKTWDAMDKMNAINQFGDVVEATRYEEEDVNRIDKTASATEKIDQSRNGVKKSFKKRKQTTSSSATPTTKKSKAMSMKKVS